MIKRLIAVPVAALALMYAGTASAAVTFTNLGDSVTLDYNGQVNGAVAPGLSAEIVFTLSQIVGNNYTFTYNLMNTSSSPITASRISSFGMNVDPNFTTASIISGSIFTSASSGNVPEGFPNVEFCGTAGSNCSGGGGNGVLKGGSSIGSFMLAYGSAPGTITWTDPEVRYQSISGAAGGDSGVGGGVLKPTPQSAVPEPATWAMMLAGFAVIGYTLRKQRAPTNRLSYRFA